VIPRAAELNGQYTAVVLHAAVEDTEARRGGLTPRILLQHRAQLPARTALFTAVRAQD
jgi:hypothetical protein